MENDHNTPTTTPQWILQARERVSLVELAEALGYEVAEEVYKARPENPLPRRRLRLTPCPKCGAEGRGGARVRRVKRTGWTMWLCHRCDATSGNLDLAAYTLAGERLGDLDDDGRAMIRAWFAAQGWCDDEDLAPMTRGEG